MSPFDAPEVVEAKLKISEAVESRPKDIEEFNKLLNKLKTVQSDEEDTDENEWSNGESEHSDLESESESEVEAKAKELKSIKTIKARSKFTKHYTDIKNDIEAKINQTDTTGN